MPSLKRDKLWSKGNVWGKHGPADIWVPHQSAEMGIYEGYERACWNWGMGRCEMPNDLSFEAVCHTNARKNTLVTFPLGTNESPRENILLNDTNDWTERDCSRSECDSAPSPLVFTHSTMHSISFSRVPYMGLLLGIPRVSSMPAMVAGHRCMLLQFMYVNCGQCTVMCHYPPQTFAIAEASCKEHGFHVICCLFTR